MVQRRAHRASYLGLDWPIKRGGGVGGVGEKGIFLKRDKKLNSKKVCRLEIF
jgi:hypothetical protein